MQLSARCCTKASSDRSTQTCLARFESKCERLNKRPGVEGGVGPCRYGSGYAIGFVSRLDTLYRVEHEEAQLAVEHVEGEGGVEARAGQEAVRTLIRLRSK